MRYLKILFFGACLSCLALQCDPNDKDDEQKPTYYMSEEFKDYVLFPEGSWWVYENQEGVTDSLKLVWQQVEMQDSRNLNIIYEGFQHHFYSSHLKDTLYGGGGAQFKGSEGPDIYNKGYMSRAVSQFFTAKDTGQVLEFNSEIAYKEYKDTFHVNSSVYLKVKKYEMLERKYDTQPEILFWAKNVGIIKKELFNGTVWKLKDYHINH